MSSKSGVSARKDSGPLARGPARALAMERDQQKVMSIGLYAKVEEILFRLDPVGINCGDNADEYAPEVATILPRLAGAGSESDVHCIVHEEFVQWFGEETAGNESRKVYKDAAKEIWRVWLELS